MINPDTDIPLPPREETVAPLPWSLADTWIGVGLLVLILAAFILIAVIFKPLLKGHEAFIVLFSELIYIFPVLIVLAVRCANYKFLGYHKFDAGTAGLGCGLVVAAYCITIINNLIFARLGQSVQADEITKLLGSLSSPVSFVIAGVILAPIVEETFFRGFLFGGFRQRYGYQKAALLSSAIFAAAHLQLSAFIPTFLLGYIFSYLTQRSNSILPGMLMHFLVNAFGIFTILILMHFGVPTSTLPH
jgi:uncharacterized protein